MYTQATYAFRFMWHIAYTICFHMNAIFLEVLELRAQTPKVTCKVTQDHGHSIGHIAFHRPILVFHSNCLYLVPFQRYYHLFTETERGHVILNTSHLRVIYQAYGSIVMHHDHVSTKFEVSTFRPTRSKYISKRREL